MNRLTPGLALEFIFLAAHPWFPWSGRGEAISDRDTIKVMHFGKAERIRLHCIHCPQLVSVVNREE